MDFSRLRLPAALALALVLGTVGVGVAPATAATALVTVHGHVTNADGKPLAGIEIEATCGCDDSSAHFASTTTSSTGAYSVRATADDAVYFTDPKGTYFDELKEVSSGGAGHVVDMTLKRISIISGTIKAAHGAPLDRTTVQIFDAKTGKRADEGEVGANGRYTARVVAGSYKVLFGGLSGYIVEEWYGGFPTRAQSPTVTVGDGATVDSIDATVEPKPTISGDVTIDGKLPLDDVKERLLISLVNAKGVEVDRTVTSGPFSFVDVIPGSFTVIVRPTTGSGPYVSPLATKVILKQGAAVSGLTIDLTPMPASKSSTRSSDITFKPSSNRAPTSGSVLKGKIIVASYGDVTGGKVLIYVNGAKVASRTLPASGRINWKTRLGTVTMDKFTVKVRYLGTDTTRSRSDIVYGLSAP